MSDALIMAGRSLRLSTRSPEALLTALMLPVMLMVVFVYLFGGAVDIGTEYVDYVVPGVLLLCAVTGASTTAVTVCQDMAGGIIDRFRSLDVSGTAVLAGHVAASLLRNVVSTLLVTAVAFGLGFRPHASVAAFAAALGVLLLFVAAASWFAAAFGLLVRAPEAANSAMFFLMFFCYASSAFVPVRTMPSWLRGFAAHQPATPVTETIRGLLLGHSAPLPLGAALAWCIGIRRGLGGRRRGPVPPPHRLTIEVPAVNGVDMTEGLAGVLAARLHQLWGTPVEVTSLRQLSGGASREAWDIEVAPAAMRAPAARTAASSCSATRPTGPPPWKRTSRSRRRR